MKISHILQESPQLCPECGGPAFGDLLLAEKKDACYSKVRSRYKVWPSAYASGALVQCRKKGAANWGNKNESADDNFGKSAALMTASPEALKTAQDIVQKQADKNVIGQAKIAGAVPDQGVAEGSETEGTATLAKIAAAGDNGYDMIEDGLNGLLGTEAQIMLQDMYDDVSREHRLHPDDDFEQIYDRMMDRIESDYGQTGMAEAPGAETLAHNQSTVASNEKAFDLEESKPKEKEADYGADYQDMVARVKKLAGAGPLKTVWDEKKRVYRNVPTAQQPNKGSQSNA